jgi:hypothetical protein
LQAQGISLGTDRHMTYDDLFGAFDRVYKEFLLRRVVHDLGNSISGINSLSDYHLRAGVNDAALEESLSLIRESAEKSRELLVAVGTLLQPPEGEEELVTVRTLIVETAETISLLLPRTVQFETTSEGRTDAVISVVRANFVRKILSLVAMDLVDLRIPRGSIQLACVVSEPKVRIRFSSTIRSDSALRGQASSFLAELGHDAEIKQVGEEGALALTMDFPIIEQEDSQAPVL